MVPFRNAGAFLCGLVLLHLPLGAAVLVHDYTLRGTLEDRLGGDALTALGGQITSLGYIFSENQGLAFSSRAFTPADYSLELSFKFDSPAGTSKIMDFHNLTSDPGLYQTDGALAFRPAATATVPDFTAGIDLHLVLTRDAASKVVTAYVNGEQRFSFVDNLALATTPGFSNRLAFFVDDETNASGGTANYIRVFNGALTGNDVSTLFAAGHPSVVPEPSTFILLTIGTAALAYSTRRRPK